ncbi:hypothetical protein [Alicyclobacillus sp. SP_1]|jgi:hypothetical protein|uniref:hypothetical protein n=1 Tax=Alicyclobacillus sp. SP_1 TaxID=2942475 RepID=UPI0021580B9A|nr:hypothetical protein [Alicyclobacillus sp. SP_1]
MLNEVLEAFVELEIDETLGKDATLAFVRRVVKIGEEHDGNVGEILEGLERFGLCYLCLKASDVLRQGLCPPCAAETFGH